MRVQTDHIPFASNHLLCDVESSIVLRTPSIAVIEIKSMNIFVIQRIINKNILRSCAMMVDKLLSGAVAAYKWSRIRYQHTARYSKLYELNMRVNCRFLLFFFFIFIFIFRGFRFLYSGLPRNYSFFIHFFGDNDFKNLLFWLCIVSCVVMKCIKNRLKW